MIGKIYKKKIWTFKRKKEMAYPPEFNPYIKSSPTNEQIIEDLEDENEDLRNRITILEFLLTVVGLTLGWYLNKTYHWF